MNVPGRLRQCDGNHGCEDKIEIEASIEVSLRVEKKEREVPQTRHKEVGRTAHRKFFNFGHPALTSSQQQTKTNCGRSEGHQRCPQDIESEQPSERRIPTLETRAS